MGFLVKGIPNLTPREALEVLKVGGELIDLRPAFFHDWKQFGVQNISYLEEDKVIDFIKKQPRDKVFIIAETSTSDKASGIIRELLDAGYHRVFNLAGGFLEWERDGLPVTEDRKERLSGSCMCQLKPRQRQNKPNK